MSTYPVGKRRPVKEEIPTYLDNEGYDLPPVRRPPRRSVQRYEEEEDPRYRPMEEEYDRRPERRSIDRVTLVAFVLFFIMLASTIGMAINSNGIANDLSNIRWDLDKEKTAHNTTEMTLNNMTALATDRNHTIFSLMQNLTARTNTLNLTKQSLNSTKHILNDTVAEVNRLMTNKTELLTQLALWKNLHPYNVDNPTYAAFKAFYQSDKTNNRTYNDTTYNCQNFAKDFKANASIQGIRCAFIILTYNSTNGHCMNAVATKDLGTVYIEPQSDTEWTPTQIAVGQLYQGKLIKSVLVIW